MMDPTGMYGMYGMGGYGAPGATDPSQMKNMMMAHMLLSQQSSGGAAGTPAGGISNAGNNMMAYLLSNPAAMAKFKTGAGNIGTGIGNLMGGYQWGGMPQQGTLDGLSSQADGYMAAGVGQSGMPPV